MQNKKKIFVLIGLAIFAAFLVYSVKEYLQSGIAEQGVVTCDNGQCFWSAHIHVFVPIQICGEDYLLTKFKGPLSDVHTHGEENVIHWHDKLRYDPKNKDFLEPSPFVLRTTLENQGIKLDADTLFDKKNGDLCNGKRSTWKVFLNGKHLSDWLNYEWRDRDIILFIFDARTAEEIEKELRQNPIEFPSLGEG